MLADKGEAFEVLLEIPAKILIDSFWPFLKEGKCLIAISP